MTIGNSLASLATLRHPLPLEDALAMLHAVTDKLRASANEATMSAACLAVYGAVCMWADDPAALTALQPPCAAIAAYPPEEVLPGAAAHLLHADEAMAVWGPGALLDPATAAAWHTAASGHAHPPAQRQPHSTQTALHQAAQLLADAAQTGFAQPSAQPQALDWSSVQTNVRLLPAMKPIDVVLTSVDRSRKVAVVLTGSWDVFCNAPDMLKGTTWLQRMLLRARRYSVVEADVGDVMAPATEVSRAAWLLTLVTDAPRNSS